MEAIEKTIENFDTTSEKVESTTLKIVKTTLHQIDILNSCDECINNA